MRWFYKLVWVCSVITLGFIGLAKANPVAIASAIGLMALGFAIEERLGCG